ncbi:MAG: hypothetical protein Q8R92_12515 [Deltaproteobacteria bacterium]|nr:hypothetical protein [Deltaproteobacteria bacterium]
MEKPFIHYDKRIAERSIRKGLLTTEEFDGFIGSLPDREGSSEILNLEEEELKPAPKPRAKVQAVEPALSEEAEPGEALQEDAPFAALEAPPEAVSAEDDPVDTPDENA